MLLFTREGFTFSLKRRERWQDDCVYPTINWAGTDLFEFRPHFSSILSLFGSRILVMLTGKWAPLSCHLSLSLSLSPSLSLCLSSALKHCRKCNFSILEVSTWASCPTQLDVTANLEVAAGLVVMQASCLWWTRDQERFHLVFPVQYESTESDPLMLQKETPSTSVPDLKQGPNLETVLGGDLRSLCRWFFPPGGCGVFWAAQDSRRIQSASVAQNRLLRVFCLLAHPIYCGEKQLCA